VLHRNWRAPSRHDAHGELDIVTRLGDAIHIIEVRTRHGSSHGTAEESVSPRKMAQLRVAAQAYIDANNLHNTHVQIDVIAIALNVDNSVKQLEYFEGAV
jgi:putative endonuclease